MFASSLPRGWFLVGLVALAVVVTSVTLVLLIQGIVSLRDRQIDVQGPADALFTGRAELYATQVREDPRLRGISNGHSLKFVENNMNNSVGGQASFFRDRIAFRPGRVARLFGCRPDWIPLRGLTSWTFGKSGWGQPLLQLHFKDDTVLLIVRREAEVSAVMQQLGFPYGST
jgi:hypothetical protein